MQNGVFCRLKYLKPRSFCVTKMGYCLKAFIVMCMINPGCCQTTDGPNTINTIPDPPRVTLTPYESDNTGGRVTIECIAPPVDQDNGPALAMFMSRKLDIFPETSDFPIVITFPPLIPNATLISIEPLGKIVSGSLEQRMITLTLTTASCFDTGVYTCNTMTIQQSLFPVGAYQIQTDITIQVAPGNINMTAEPSGVNSWKVNDILLMRCNGTVGTVWKDSQVHWVWQYKDPGLNEWAYVQFGPNNVFAAEPSVNTNNPCYKRQVSTLKRRLALDDTGRQYRCYVINNDLSSPFPAVYSVGNVTEREDLPNEALSIAVIGGIIGGIVAVVCVCVAAIVICRIKRQKKAPETPRAQSCEPSVQHNAGLSDVSIDAKT